MPLGGLNTIENRVYREISIDVNDIFFKFYFGPGWKGVALMGRRRLKDLFF